MLKVETDQKYAHIFCKWLEGRFNRELCFDPSTTRTIGHVEVTKKDGKVEIDILAVAALHRWSPHGCEITVASNGDKRQKASRAFIWTVFDFVFNHANKQSMFATISSENHKCLALADAMGLTQRGELPDYFGENTKGFIYTITKKEWKSGRWAQLSDETINKVIPKEQPQKRNTETVQ